MIKIDEEILKKLMAIVTAYADDDNDYYFVSRRVIDQLENYNGFDDHTLFNFLWDVKKLREEISSNQNFMTKMKKRGSANRKKDKK